MIALLDGIPCVKTESGELRTIDRAWLQRSLESAARKAGFPNWWLAGHVAASVLAHFAEGTANALNQVQLTKAVQSALQVIGYAEVAAHFSWQEPPPRISLPELAQRAGSGYELVFFEMLRRHVREVLTPHTVHLELIGLKTCVRQLRANKHWSRPCDQLRSEIVAFVRRQLLQNPAASDITVALS